MSTFELSDACCWAGRRVARRIVDVSSRHRAILKGRITDVASVRVGTGPAYRCVLDDGSGQVDLFFIGRRYVPGIELGTLCRVEGTVQADGDRLAVWNPLYVLEPAAGQAERAAQVAADLRRAG